MNDKEKELREKIRKECFNYETNFSGIDTLTKMENDWRVAQQKDNYNFESCPSNFDCLEDFVGLCEIEDAEDAYQQCQDCWKKALGN